MKKYLEHIVDFKLLEFKGLTITVYDVLLVVFVIVVTKAITFTIELLIKKRLSKKGVIEEGRGNSVTQILKYTVYVLSVFIVLKSLGIDISVVLGVFAALGLGVGFALQDVFKDLISGIIILFEGNVSVGDVLEVDGLIGSVEEIKLRTSLIKTREGIYMFIPNSKVVNEKVINWTANNKITRFYVSVGVAYGSDVEKVRSLLLQCAGEHPMVSKKMQSLVFFNDFGDSSLQFQLHFWVLDVWRIELIKSELRFAINKLFKENNIEIPFPQREVHLIQK